MICKVIAVEWAHIGKNVHLFNRVWNIRAKQLFVFLLFFFIMSVSYDVNTFVQPSFSNKWDLWWWDRKGNFICITQTISCQIHGIFWLVWRFGDPKMPVFDPILHYSCFILFNFCSFLTWQKFGPVDFSSSPRLKSLFFCLSNFEEWLWEWASMSLPC